MFEMRACSSMVRARSLYLRGSRFESWHAHKTTKPNAQRLAFVAFVGRARTRKPEQVEPAGETARQGRENVRATANTLFMTESSRPQWFGTPTTNSLRDAARCNRHNINSLFFLFLRSDATEDEQLLELFAFYRFLLYQSFCNRIERTAMLPNNGCSACF